MENKPQAATDTDVQKFGSKFTYCPNPKNDKANFIPPKPKIDIEIYDFKVNKDLSIYVEWGTGDTIYQLQANPNLVEDFVKFEGLNIYYSLEGKDSIISTDEALMSFDRPHAINLIKYIYNVK